MAKTETHAAKAAGWKVGDVGIFKGYSGLPEGAEELLKENDPVKVVNFEGDADIIVVKTDENGEPLTGDAEVVERLYAEELEKAEVVPDEEVAEAEVEAPKATEGKGKGKSTSKKGSTSKKATTAKGGSKAKSSTKAQSPKAQESEAAAPVELVDMASVTSILDEQDALEAAKSLVEQAEQTDFTLGGVLRHIHETGVFKSLGYTGKRGFDDYVEKELGIQSRKARYLMQIYTKFAMLGVDETKLQEIGWSKAKELARINDDDLKANFDDLIEFASDNTRDDLIGHIKDSYAVTSRQTRASLAKFNFTLAEEEAESVRTGLTEACAIIGEQDLNKAFAYIVNDWRNNAAGSDMTLDDMVGMMEAKFGVTVTTEPNPEAEQAVGAEASADAEEAVLEPAE